MNDAIHKALRSFTARVAEVKWTAENETQIVRLFQAWRGLQVDGILGDATLTELGISTRQEESASDSELVPLVDGVVQALRGIGEYTRSNNFAKNGGYIFKACEEAGVTDLRHVAYILATASHESLFAPIKEWRANAGTRMRAIQDRYWHTGYMGHGFVQLTHKTNYAKASKLIGVDLVAKPELALAPKWAAKIMVTGMREGMFTGHRLDHHINDTKTDFVGARKIVNWTDKDKLIASYADYYLKLLQKLSA